MEAQVVTVQPDQEKHWEEHGTGGGGAFQVGVGLPVQTGLGKKVAFEWRLQKQEAASRGKRMSTTSEAERGSPRKTIGRGSPARLEVRQSHRRPGGLG